MNSASDLVLTSVAKRFGGLVAVDGVTLRVGHEQIVSLIGPNGAGKSTLFDLITGMSSCDSGSISYRSQRLDGQPPRFSVACGVARTFQTTQVLRAETVLFNMMVGRQRLIGGGLFRALIGCRQQRHERPHLAKCRELLDFCGIANIEHAIAGRQPVAIQQRLAIAMALASEPSLILMDEPTGGLVENEVGELADLIRRIRATGISVLLIEHKMGIVMSISDWIYVLNRGRVIANGLPDLVRADRAVVEAYLGTA